MEALASMELDDTVDDLVIPVSSARVSPTRAPHTFSRLSLNKTWTECAATQFWPVGLVLSTAPAVRKTFSVDGFQKELCLLLCLKIPRWGKNWQTESIRSEHGIASIRALPQGTIKFHYKKSPLLYANTCPILHTPGISGFNEILLEKTRS